MDLFTISSIVIALSALFGYINVRFLKLPNTIGLMLIAIVFTMILFATSLVNDSLYVAAENMVGQIEFDHVLLDILLGFLLFAGAMHTNFDQLKVQRWPILVFSTLGVVASTFITGGFVFYLLQFMGMGVPFIHCLLFGALISPTDPIAVLGILKKAGVPKKLETKIVGESLFNDGVGVVVFLTILGIAQGSGHGDSDAFDIVKLFGQEVLGGIAMGGILGYGTYLLLRSIDDYDIEVMITLACVMGGYTLAHYLHLSAPLAMVVAGLVVGNDTVRGTSMSDITEQYVDKFWELVDMLLNAILFVLIGLEMLILTFNGKYILAGLISIVLVLLARYLSLFIPVKLFSDKLEFVPHTDKIMTWGGLRGGISIALALSLPIEMSRDIFIIMTYVVVVFSILVQGLTIGKFATRLIGKEQMLDSTDEHGH
ncbi:MAG: CPA1 family monovalent cation:H+ antiporter [Saprospiraceae bacterium]|jgi:CPA1 family monovalent cation:H+ antiporter